MVFEKGKLTLSLQKDTTIEAVEEFAKTLNFNVDSIDAKNMTFSKR